MDLEKVYYDTDGTECNILQLVKKEPEWAANRVQAGEVAISELFRLNETVLSSQPVVKADALCSLCCHGVDDLDNCNFCPDCGRNLRTA